MSSAAEAVVPVMDVSSGGRRTSCTQPMVGRAGQ